MQHVRGALLDKDDEGSDEEIKINILVRVFKK